MIFLELAFIIATVVKSLVSKLINKTKLKDILAKLDSNGKEDFIGKLVYLLVFLPFVTAIFSALGMSSVVSPTMNLLKSECIET